MHKIRTAVVSLGVAVIPFLATAAEAGSKWN